MVVGLEADGGFGGFLDLINLLIWTVFESEETGELVVSGCTENRKDSTSWDWIKGRKGSCTKPQKPERPERVLEAKT